MQTLPSSMGYLPDDESPGGRLLERLDAFRRVLLFALSALLAALVACFSVSKTLFEWLLAPLRSALPAGASLVATRVPEIFVVHLKVALFAAVLVTVPVWLALLARFVSRVLRKSHRAIFAVILLLGTVLFATGALFAHYVLFPYGARFLTHFGDGSVHVLLNVEEAFSFYGTFVLGIGLVFEMPTLALVLSMLGLVTPRLLVRYAKEALVLVFVVAAVVTPTPDVVTQMLVALPMTGLYALSIVLSWLVHRAGAAKPRGERTRPD